MCPLCAHYVPPLHPQVDFWVDDFRGPFFHWNFIRIWKQTLLVMTASFLWQYPIAQGTTTLVRKGQG